MEVHGSGDTHADPQDAVGGGSLSLAHLVHQFNAAPQDLFRPVAYISRLGTALDNLPADICQCQFKAGCADIHADYVTELGIDPEQVRPASALGGTFAHLHQETAIDQAEDFLGGLGFRPAGDVRDLGTGNAALFSKCAQNFAPPPNPR